MRSLSISLLIFLTCASARAAADTPATVPATTTTTTTRAASTGPATAPTFTRKQDVVYGRAFGTALTMDVFTPNAPLRPNGAAVIVVVSGGWVSNHDALGSPFIDL